MAEASNLTLRVPADLKTEVDKAAAAENRSITDFWIRAVRERLERTCPACGRGGDTDSGESFTAFAQRLRAEQKYSGVTVTTLDRRVYFGRIPEVIDTFARMRFCMESDDGFSDVQWLLPLTQITGVAYDPGGTLYRQTLESGSYEDGNEPARKVWRQRRR